MAELVKIGHEFGLQPWLTPWARGRRIWRRVGQLRGRRTPGSLPARQRRPASTGALPAATGVSLADRRLDRRGRRGRGRGRAMGRAAPGAAVSRGSHGPWACRCDACQEAFQDRFGKPMPETVTPEVETFLDDLVSDTLAWMVEAARERGLQSSIVLLANESYDPALWRAAASLPGVRYFGDDGVLAFLRDPGCRNGDVSLALGGTHPGGNRRNGCRAAGMGAGVRRSGGSRARGRAGGRDPARRRCDDDRGLVVSRLRRHVRSGP